jgi:putative Mg2+ transporter-C (MgtC) family protein
MSVFTFTLHLAIALVLGIAIGLERQWHHRLAGLQTNALVSSGSSLFVMASLMLNGKEDPTRIAAQIVSGIGFLGGGVILREGLNVRGLNTAATLWCSAAVGMLAGFGMLFESVIGASVVVVANLMLRPLAAKMDKLSFRRTGTRLSYRFEIFCPRDKQVELLTLLRKLTEQDHLRLNAVRVTAAQDRIEVKAEISAPVDHLDFPERLLSHLRQEIAITEVSWERLEEVHSS